MIKKLILILLVCSCSFSYAQTVKTDVLVIGGSPSGVAAALQSARSKVKTILAVTGSALGNFPATGNLSVSTCRNVPSGIWGEFRKWVREIEKKAPNADTAQNAILNFDAHTGATAFKELTDTVKNLTTYLNTPFISIKKDDDRWDVNITQNGKTMLIKARVVIDATEKGEVVEKAGIKLPQVLDNYKNNVGLKEYRTSIASGENLPPNLFNEVKIHESNYPPHPSYYIPMNALVVNGADNLLITEKVLRNDKYIQYLPLQLELGQGAGVIAAYCAFFKTTTKNLKVRTIQGELLDFKGCLLPFTDIGLKDSNWRAVQQVCATGLLKGKGGNGQFIFMPDAEVNTEEIKPVLTEIYTRAFLWFNKEKPAEKFTVGNMLSFISDNTLTDPDILKNNLQKAWKTQYKFTGDFDLKRPISRREFAVLANKFLNPFARTVDLSGRLVN